MPTATTPDSAIRVSPRLLRLCCAIALCAGLGLASTAQADRAKAEQLYRQGLTQYNLGNFDEAIRLYRLGYEELTDPAFLFNIAQAYRQKGDCQQAAFFYKRFLSSAPKAPQRKEVEERLKELRENCKRAADTADRPPRETIKPNGTTQTGDKPGGNKVTGSGSSSSGSVKATEPDDGDDDDDDDDDDDVDDSLRLDSHRYMPTKVASHVAVGTAFVGIGDLDVPAQFSLGLGAGYPLTLGKVDVDVGGAFTLTPVPWDNPMVASGTAILTSFLANVRAAYPIANKLAARGEFGIGAMMMSGLDEGNVFTQNGKATTGAVGMFNLRMGLSAEYAVTPNIVVTAAPVMFSYSPAKDDVFRDDISSLTRFELMVGVGYRR